MGQTHDGQRLYRTNYTLVIPLSQVLGRPEGRKLSVNFRNLGSIHFYWEEIGRISDVETYFATICESGAMTQF